LLERRLEAMRRQEARMQEILDRLDAGEAPAEIFAELREDGEWTLLGEFGRERFAQRQPGGEMMRGGRGGGMQAAERKGFDDLTPEEATLLRNRILSFLEQHAPEMAQRLRESGDSPEVNRAINRLRREVLRLIELKEQQSPEFRPALEQLRNGMRIADVVGRIRQAAAQGEASGERLASLRKELTEIAEDQFDAQFAARQLFLERAEQRLINAREKLARERAERSQRIEREVQIMIDRALRAAQLGRTDEPASDGPRERGGPR